VSIDDNNGKKFCGQLGLADQVDLSRGPAGLGVVTGPDGRYTFPGLPPGRWHCVASPN
jgi:hypothetical protein